MKSVFGKNVQSMLKLGRAQGVAFSAALSKEVLIAEYAQEGEEGDNWFWRSFKGTGCRDGSKTRTY